MTQKLQVSANAAPQIAEWITERWGVAVWPGLDLSNPRNVYSPVVARDLDAEGNLAPHRRPHWSVGAEPARVVTSLEDVEVLDWQEHKRFRVGLRRGSQGFAVKLTDAASRRVRAACGALRDMGFEAAYTFDYTSQEAVILRCDKPVPLVEFLAKLSAESAR